MRIPSFTNFLAKAREATAPLRTQIQESTFHPRQATKSSIPTHRGALETSVRRLYAQVANSQPQGRNTANQYASTSTGPWRDPYGVSMRYHPVTNAQSGRPAPVNTAPLRFPLHMTTAQRLSWSIANFERNKLRRQEESDLQQAIKASLQDMRRTSEGSVPVFHHQFSAAEAALRNGHPSGNMCGALALAHMSGTHPQWPQLHAVAMNDLLQPGPSGRVTEAQLKEAKKIVYEGVYVEHLQALLTKNKVPFETLSAVDPAELDPLFYSGKTKGVTYGYMRPGGAVHFAALRKDPSGQWWDMDSYHERPQKIASPAAFLKEKCASELRAGRGFDLIYTDA